MYYFRSLIYAVAAAAGVALGAAGYWSARLAYADSKFRSGTPEGVAEAVHLAPYSAEYESMHALQLDYAGEDPGPSLERVTRLDPLYSAAWIRLGLRAEVRGNFAEAERLLVHAASIDHQYEPRWTLANFYFRRAREAEFWHWTRQAFEISYGDRRPLFELCRRMSADPKVILARAIPDQRPVLASYLMYLLDQHEEEAALPVARKLVAAHEAEDRGLLLGYCDRLLAVRKPEPALKVWRWLCGAKLAPYAAPDASQGRSLTNGDFRRAPLQQGFDWRTPQVEGVSPAYLADAAAMKLDFSGKQPEQCELLEELVSVLPSRRYRLRWEHRFWGSADGGLEWQVNGGSVTPAGLEATDDWSEHALEFVSPAGAQFLELSLGYRRQMGAARLEGSLWLRNVRLDLIE